MYIQPERSHPRPAESARPSSPPLPAPRQRRDPLETLPELPRSIADPAARPRHRKRAPHTHPSSSYQTADNPDRPEPPPPAPTHPPDRAQPRSIAEKRPRNR